MKSNNLYGISVEVLECMKTEWIFAEYLYRPKPHRKNNRTIELIVA